MGYFAYHRISSKGQKEFRGVDEINKYCKENNITLYRPIFIDKQSGKNFDRHRYIVMKEDVLREGDCLIITEVDRMGRNKNQIVDELRYFKERGVRVLILELPTTLMKIENESTLNGLILETISNMIIEIFACLAEAELEKKNIRQAEGIQAMKDRGNWDKYGRPRAIDFDKFIKVYEKVRENELQPFQAIKELEISKATYYRYRKEYEDGLKKDA